MQHLSKPALAPFHCQTQERDTSRVSRIQCSIGSLAEDKVCTHQQRLHCTFLLCVIVFLCFCSAPDKLCSSQCTAPASVLSFAQMKTPRTSSRREKMARPLSRYPSRPSSICLICWLSVTRRDTSPSSILRYREMWMNVSRSSCFNGECVCALRTND